MKPNYAGLRSYRIAEQTGRPVAVYDGIEAGLDTSSGKWQTICEEHGTIISHRTLKLALSHAADPLSWCEECQRLSQEPQSQVLKIDLDETRQLMDVERIAIVYAVHQEKTIKAAAKRLRIGESTVYKKLRLYGLNKKWISTMFASLEE